MVLTRAMASLVTLPIFLQFVAAIPNAPVPTPAAHLDKRANGANTIGFSLSGTTWRTRSCNTGYFSTSGTLGNCCVDNDCNFLTGCTGSTIFYANGNTATCASSTCGAGTILKTPGDQSPLTMFNCQSAWTVTETPSVTDSSSSSPTSRSSSPTSTDSSTTTSDSSSIPAPDTTSVESTGPSTTRAVTMTVTNADGTVETTTSVQAVPAASGTPDPNALTSSQTDNDNNGGSSNAGAIAGGVVGGVAVIAIVAGVIGFLVWKRNKKAKEAAAGTTTPLDPDGSGPSTGPQPQQMSDASAYNANQGYQAYVPPPVGQYPQATGPHSQDYKMPLAGGGYAEGMPQQGGMGMAPPQHLDGTPVEPNRASELYGGTVHAPVEMPAQTGYGR